MNRSAKKVVTNYNVLLNDCQINDTGIGIWLHAFYWLFIRITLRPTSDYYIIKGIAHPKNQRKKINNLKPSIIDLRVLTENRNSQTYNLTSMLIYSEKNLEKIFPQQKMTSGPPSHITVISICYTPLAREVMKQLCLTQGYLSHYKC